MKKITDIKEIMDILEECKHGYYGFRNATEHDLEIMERGYLDCSHDFIDNVDTGEELKGTCAIGIHEYLSEEQVKERYYQTLKGYEGHTILLLGDRLIEYGNDENEVILGSKGCGSDVIAIVELGC